MCIRDRITITAGLSFFLIISSDFDSFLVRLFGGLSAILLARRRPEGRKRVRLGCLSQNIAVHMRINLRRIELLVSENLFKRQHVDAVLIHQRRRRMPELVGGILIRIQPRLAEPFFDQPLDRHRADARFAARHKQSPLSRRRVLCAFRQVGFNGSAAGVVQDVYKRQILGIDDVFGRPEGRDYQKQFAVELVKRGMLVAAPEIIGFGESRIYDHINGEGYGGDCSPLAGQTLLTGGSIGGLRVYEMQRVLDYVVSLPEFDGKNLGCIGISGGGTVTTNLAAVDLRVTAAVVSGYANFYKTSICAVSHCIDNYLPSILRYAEMPDLLGLIAPRPLMISSGSEDRIFPVAATRRAVEKLSALYAALGLSLIHI